MARAFWKGSLSFGLVEIPVSLRPAMEPDELHFTLLDRKDFSPVGYRRYNKSTGREVEWDQIVRGYEYEPDEYVVLTDEEIRGANVKASGTIEIMEFVEAAQIDPALFEAPYFVEPVKKASKSYALLLQALQETGKVGIARVVLRTRQRLAALVPRGPVLALILLRYAHELRKPGDLDLPATDGKKGSVSEREVKLAERLIDEMTSKRWDPSRYKDEYRDEVLDLVRQKVKSGKTHTILEPEKGTETRRARSDVVDLMPLLKKSLEAHGARGEEDAQDDRAKRAPRRASAKPARAGAKRARSTPPKSRGRKGGGRRSA
ncbi:MAG TPA: Ku protein [Candidatus Eisenbacteria bacterium]|nr:Ku protein [Candidatus Eisenbacteria bacterium]